MFGRNCQNFIWKAQGLLMMSLVVFSIRISNKMRFLFMLSIVLHQAFYVTCLVPLMFDVIRLGSTPVDLIKVLDMCDAQSREQRISDNGVVAFNSETFVKSAEKMILNAKKYSILTDLLKTNRTEYIATVNFLKNRKSLYTIIPIIPITFFDVLYQHTY